MIFSGLAKLFEFNSFIINPAEQGIVPPVLFSPIIMTLCTFELVLGSVLILDIFKYVNIFYFYSFYDFP